MVVLKYSAKDARCPARSSPAAPCPRDDHDLTAMANEGVHDELIGAVPQLTDYIGVNCGSMVNRLDAEPFEAPRRWIASSPGLSGAIYPRAGVCRGVSAARRC
jgi:hypothetical protein